MRVATGVRYLTGLLNPLRLNWRELVRDCGYFRVWKWIWRDYFKFNHWLYISRDEDDFSDSLRHLYVSKTARPLDVSSHCWSKSAFSLYMSSHWIVEWGPVGFVPYATTESTLPDCVIEFNLIKANQSKQHSGNSDADVNMAVTLAKHRIGDEYAWRN